MHEFLVCWQNGFIGWLQVNRSVLFFGQHNINVVPADTKLNFYSYYHGFFTEQTRCIFTAKVNGHKTRILIQVRKQFFLKTTAILLSKWKQKDYFCSTNNYLDQVIKILSTIQGRLAAINNRLSSNIVQQKIHRFTHFLKWPIW